jgi:hypothetical protein
MTDKLDISIGGQRIEDGRGPDVWADRRTTKSDAGFCSGSGDFDRMLERLHAAFAEMEHPSARDAADDLARHYHAMTGRARPEADASAGELAAQLHAGLLTTFVSLTDTRGQTMLRLLG